MTQTTTETTSTQDFSAAIAASAEAKILGQYKQIEQIDKERKSVNSGSGARMNLIKEATREDR